ncbi:hypothetical protein BU24DRAFT_202379 [Aaosphaeria arxii CBS 175.79]|uniref:Uncharacterized protein n=1 Tax=Aaosphaeria arxii CBS 175.79 TaxID=1450172 RepID=A0A6A5XW51_9PLEO|nr:uncharacterized protein BU24DRAFT_202379 [Aaosphaeria arxii CBS 175.79]KAF2016464.1 hypothetical protein BU24DRAFT_202379 [Aaosphaeria arxii CBS 175.79]
MLHAECLTLGGMDWAPCPLTLRLCRRGFWGWRRAGAASKCTQIAAKGLVVVLVVVGDVGLMDSSPSPGGGGDGGGYRPWGYGPWGMMGRGIGGEGDR